MSFLKGIKATIKSKPIRIIAALCIIAAIMFAIGIGISALVKKLTDKCANQPGTDWNSDLKMCVPRGCDDGGPVCKIKNASDDKSGKCIPADYCNYIDKGGNNYQYLDEYCACTISCSEGEPVDPKTGLNHTNMHLSDSGSGYEPNNPLSCKTKCKFNPNEKGGYGYCDTDDECKVSISKYYDEKILSEAGCLSSFSDITQLQVCNDTNVVCEQGQCSDTEQPFKIDDTSRYPNFPKDTTFKSYCNNFVSCTDDSKIVACTQDTDCSIGTYTSGKCDFTNTKLKNKGFEYVGVCSNSSEISKYDNNCLSVDKIGENKFTGDITRNKLIHKIIDNKVGISLNQPQCLTTDNAECQQSEIMHNWFCDTNKTNSCQYITDKIQSCTDTPPNTKTNSSATAFCCPKDNIAKGSNPTSFCCPKKTRNGYCLNTSKYHPDPNWLGMDNITCSNDGDCKDIGDKLRSTLSGSEDSNDENYVGSFCDSKTCKFFAGYVESLEENGKYSPNYYFIGNDETKQISQAVKVNNDISFSLPLRTKQNPANLTMCKPAGSSSNYYFGLYNSNLEPYSPPKTADYITQETLTAQSSTRPVTLTDCMNYNNKTSGEFSVDSASIAENASGANYDSDKMSINEESCTYDILCNKASSTVCIDKQNSKKLNINNGNDSCSKGSAQSLDWNFSLDKIGGQLYDEEGNAIYFVRKPKGSSDTFVTSCSDIPADTNSCEDTIPLSSELDKYKNYFKSPCAIIGGNCTDSLNLPEYNFETGTYCKDGFKFKNGELNCLKK